MSHRRNNLLLQGAASFINIVYTSYTMEKLVKGISRESWKEFRSEAAKHGYKVGEFFSYLVEEHTKMEEKSRNWDSLFKRKPLNEKDAMKMREAVKLFEKEHAFE